MGKIRVMFAALILAAPLLSAGPPAASAAQAPSLDSNDRVLGKADAPITIIEYASLTCPHCAAFSQQTLPKVKQEWIATGKAKLVYRDYPLDRSAVFAAMIAHCLPPGRFFDAVERLFSTQKQWAYGNDVQQQLTKFAVANGMTQASAERCMKDDKLSDAIVAQAVSANKKYGVGSTPTFFINGRKFSGEMPYPEFSKILADALTKH